MALDYNEVFQFMQEFGINVLNQYNELIIDVKWNIYASLDNCETIEDVKTNVIYALCRPIGKGLEINDATKLLNKVNKYFKVELTRKDMRLIYGELCYSHKYGEFKEFIKQCFPMEKLKKAEG